MKNKFRLLFILSFLLITCAFAFANAPSTNAATYESTITYHYVDSKGVTIIESAPQTFNSEMGLTLGNPTLNNANWKQPAYKFKNWSVTYGNTQTEYKVLIPPLKTSRNYIATSRWEALPIALVNDNSVAFSNATFESEYREQIVSNFQISDSSALFFKLTSGGNFSAKSGLTLTEEGTLTGFPKSAGEYTFSVTAFSKISGAEQSCNYKIKINKSKPRLTMADYSYDKLSPKSPSIAGNNSYYTTQRSSYRNDSNGATTSSPPVIPGTYKVTIVFDESDNCLSQTLTAKLIVTEKTSLTINTDNLKKQYIFGEVYGQTLPLDSAKPKYTTNNKEVDSLLYELITPANFYEVGKYKVTISFGGSEEYHATSTTVEVEILRSPVIAPPEGWDNGSGQMTYNPESGQFEYSGGGPELTPALAAAGLSWVLKDIFLGDDGKWYGNFELEGDLLKNFDNIPSATIPLDTENFKIPPDGLGDIKIDDDVFMGDNLADLAKMVNLPDIISKYPGTLTFDAGQLLTAGVKEYFWTYTPFDTNISPIHGSITINALNSIKNELWEIIQSLLLVIPISTDLATWSAFNAVNVLLFSVAGVGLIFLLVCDKNRIKAKKGKLNKRMEKRKKARAKRNY